MKTETPDRPANKLRERDASFTTISGRPIGRLYMSEHLPGWDYASEAADRPIRLRSAVGPVLSCRPGVPL